MADQNVVRTSDGFVFKQYRPNAGDLPSREWRALQILHEYAPGLAPEPIEADLDADPLSITMSELRGEALGGQPLSEAQLRGIAASLDRLHTCVPQDVLARVPLWPRGDAEGLARGLAAQPRPGDDAVTGRAYDQALRWLAGGEATRFLTEEPNESVLGRGDHNLSNFLWDGRHVGLVDFEYSRRSDVSDETAELVEHISARCTPDDTWQQFLDGLDFSRAERTRLLTARRLRAIMWLLLLLPGQAGDSLNPPGTLRKQAERALDILSA